MPRPLLALAAVALLAIGAAALASAKGTATHGLGPLGRQWWLFATAALAVGIMALFKLRERMSASEPDSTAGARLNRGVIAVVAVLTAALPVSLFLVRTQVASTQTACGTQCITILSTGHASGQRTQSPVPEKAVGHHEGFKLPLGLILLIIGILLGVVVVAGVILLIAKMRALTKESGIVGAPPPALTPDAQDESALGAAMLAARSALEGEARAAIIACYAAMEDSLGEAGVPRLESDSPAELLARATQRGVVHGPAPRKLARLFREARFSTHPMGEQDLGEARAALDAIVQQLGMVAP